MIRPSWRSITTAPYSAIATWAVNKPAGVVNGDLLLVAFAIGSGATVNTVPSGWVLISRTVFGVYELFMYWKIAASEGASWSWVFSSTQSGGSHCNAFSSVNQATPFTNLGTAESATSTLTTPSGTPNTVQDLLLAQYFSRTSTSGAMTQPTGMTERGDTAPQTTRCLATDTEDLASGAATGSRSTTVTNFSSYGIAQGIIIHSNPTHQGSPLALSL